jgi:uncharacterized protein YaaQ
MKMILAIIRDEDNEAISQGLIQAGFRVTRIASTGGFLRRGSSTLLLGVDDAKVEGVLAVMRTAIGPPAEPGTARATVFVLPIEHYTQI